MFDHEIPTAIEGFELAGGEKVLRNVVLQVRVDMLGPVALPRTVDRVRFSLLRVGGQSNGPLLANSDSAKSHPVLKPMFDHEIPTAIEGFELLAGSS
jgi:hypothetical protein